ncbi:nuclear receptor-interacting protein 1 [Trichomycterus rosablanca]|uniref:nuclear receptor-interacting protein 1 n=1 Tax=Trichomycterus rosablanca TaxID=2290929 RepID=UPI002F356C46
MTHGDETGPEKHQDSAVLTYLEGLLMPRVAGAQNATATQRSEAEKGKEEQENKESPGLTLPRHSTQQEQDKISPHGSTHHVKKARLLRSEAWINHESQMRSVPPVEPSKEKQEHCSGLNGSLQWKGESTLLASLLQNFSTRLQNVALSQQISQNIMSHNDTQDSGSKPEEEHRAPRDVHGSSPGLTGNSTVQNHSSSKVYHHRQSSQERLSKSPVTPQHSSQSPSSESLPCTERLKAVASMVNVRSSPAPSPKPSVACSQLALLLSSEAHLQQYSREHAIKAQLAGRSASERLAAMATQQEKKPTIYRPAQANHDGLSSLQANGKPPEVSTSLSRPSSSISMGKSRSLGSVRRTHPFRERRPFERHSRLTQNCSSLLLQLLNSHNTPQQLNCQGHMKEDVSIFSSQASPMFSDSEQSNSAYSLPKDSSDAESSRSSCSPIDLSLKSKVNFKVPQPSSSSPPLDKLTESIKNRCTPESPILNFSAESKELHACSEIKPHHKVTLLELLLDQKHNQKTNKCLNSPGLQPLIIPKVSSAPESNQALFYTSQYKDARESSPNCRRNSRSPKVLPTFSQGRDCNIRASPYNIYSPPHTQSVPLDLCKSKPTVSGSSGKEPAFSASKLLQNLAQCGTQNPVSSPTLKSQLPPIKRQLTEEFKSAALLEKLTAPIQKSTATTFEATHIKSQATPLPEPTQHTSEIENLLERRTVLQLLLGNKSKKERAGIKRKRESGKHTTSKCPSTLKTPSPDILVKTEPEEDVCRSMYNDRQVTNNILLESPRQSPHVVNQVSIKQEPQTSVPVPRDGLLPYFSYNQPTDLKPNSIKHSKRGCIKEEQVEHQGPTIPKKRKISVEPEDQADMSQQRMYNSYFTQKDNSNFSTSEIAETRESSNPCSPPAADSPPAKFPPCESPRNDTGGFNVLKQLLLSDNCLKELSQSRSTFSTPTHPVGNGSTIKEPCNNRDLQNFRQTLNPSKLSTMRPELSRQESVSDVHQDSPRSKHDISSERDSKSLANGDKRGNCDLESPRMTKANPILYYMLQRSNAHFVRDSIEPSAKVGHCRVQIKDKEASEASDVKVNLQQSPHIHNGSHSCDSPRLNGSLKKTAID